MSGPSGFQAHWVDIEPERFERYLKMFRWNPATAHYYEAADIRPRQTIVDFGCGPGFAAVEFARRVGPDGHVHAVDINRPFVEHASALAAEQGLSDRISVHLLDDDALPLDGGTADRVIARNTIIYVADPVTTFREFRRVLRPDGLAHAIEGDWGMMIVEPVPADAWQALLQSARWAWPNALIGRQLHGVARRAGFSEIAVQLLGAPDSTGRLSGMIANAIGYARTAGELPRDEIDRIEALIDRARSDGTYLAIAPQFAVTAKA
ncbi:methyltransferase domain-containing protein [Minwuia sp.]|uniref:methyltransferase domain-containing protein n=1 Tax=Minwuia sp. TaxID=2493630 RepID=UPI003A923B38